MKLYHKKLRSVQELRSEKRSLLLEKRRLEKEDIISVDGILGKYSDTVKSAKTSFMEHVVPNISAFSSPVIGLVSDIVMSRFARSKDDQLKEKKHKLASSEAPAQKGKSLLKTAAIEFIGGYLKWKAVELSYKGITLIVRKQKKKKAERKAQSELPNRG